MPYYSSVPKGTDTCGGVPKFLRGTDTFGGASGAPFYTFGATNTGAADSIRIAPPQVSVPLSAIAELGTLSRSPVTAVLLRAYQIPSRIVPTGDWYRDNTGNLSAGEAGLEPTTYSFEG